MNKTRDAFTLIEVLTVLAILATLLALLAPAFLPLHAEEESSRPPKSNWLSTVQHDGHWFITRPEGYFIHHPECPCRTKTAEAE